MPYLEGTEISCGVDQFYDLSGSPRVNLESIANQYFEFSDFRPGGQPGCAIITWSDVAGRNSNGEKLYRYIKKLFPNAGILNRTRACKNPNSGNKICMYVWKPNNKKFLTWAKKHNAFSNKFW